MSVENLKFWYDKDGNKVYGDPKKYNKCFEYLMSNNPDDVISKFGIRIRQIFHPVFTKLLPLTTKNKLKVVKRAPIPKHRPVIFAFSHGFRDDIALGLKTIKKHAYLAYASLPDFYYSIDGLALWANGVYIIDRKDRESKKALIPKIVKAHQLGQKYHAICPEGVWDKDPNEVILNLWKGFYLASREIGAVVMPVVMLNKDMDIDNDKNKACYSTLGDAVDLVRYADEITLDMLKQFNFVQSPHKIIEIVRKIHDNVDSCEKSALQALSTIIDFEKYKKDNVLAWLREVDSLYFDRISAKELLEKTEEPGLYCDEEVVKQVADILSKMNWAKFVDSYLLVDLMDTSKKTFPEIKDILNDIWNIVEEADNKAVEYFRCIMVFDKIDLMKKYSIAERKDIGDAEEYWDEYVSELIRTAKGLYDYSIENSAEYNDKTKKTEAEVFEPMKNARLIQETALVSAEYFDTYVSAFVEAGNGLYQPECNDEFGVHDNSDLKRKIKLLPQNPWVKDTIYKKKKEYFE